VKAVIDGISSLVPAASTPSGAGGKSILAQCHGISPGANAIHLHLHRLRQLVRQAVLKHIKATLENSTDDEANAELSVLLSRL